MPNALHLIQWETNMDTQDKTISMVIAGILLFIVIVSVAVITEKQLLHNSMLEALALGTSPEMVGLLFNRGN